MDAPRETAREERDMHTSLIQRIVGLYLVAFAAVLAVHTVVEPLYHVSTGDSVYSPVWEVINPLSVITVLLGVAFGVARTRAAGTAAASLSWGRLAEHTRLFGFLFVGVLLFSSWFNLLNPAYTVVGLDASVVIWMMIDAGLPLLAGALGAVLLRGASEASAREPASGGASAPAGWESGNLRWLAQAAGVFLIAVGAAVAAYIIVDPLVHASTEANPYGPLWDVVLDPLVAVSVLLGIVVSSLGKRRLDAADRSDAVTWERMAANALFYGFLFVGILFFWAWPSGLRSGTFAPGASDGIVAVWLVIYALFPLLAGVLGLRLLRGRVVDLAGSSE